ncbi:hypothetical protein [Streptomyces pilosus]|uniref:hypothetical protein n=1 Tax=Streptomyces pilosus TaxID=28893 RepID=UPI0016743896|nr:hypothetical protein [Streptomyces pilosus]
MRAPQPLALDRAEAAGIGSGSSLGLFWAFNSTDEDEHGSDKKPSAQVNEA